eukprot:g19463.t1
MPRGRGVEACKCASCRGSKQLAYSTRRKHVQKYGWHFPIERVRHSATVAVTRRPRAALAISDSEEEDGVAHLAAGRSDPVGPPLAPLELAGSEDCTCPAQDGAYLLAASTCVWSYASHEELGPSTRHFCVLAREAAEVPERPTVNVSRVVLTAKWAFDGCPTSYYYKKKVVFFARGLREGVFVFRIIVSVKEAGLSSCVSQPSVMSKRKKQRVASSAWSPSARSLDDDDENVPMAASAAAALGIVHDPHAVKLCASLLSLLEQLKQLADGKEKLRTVESRVGRGAVRSCKQSLGAGGPDDIATTWLESACNKTVPSLCLIMISALILRD